MNLPGYVLAGGASRRMGQDKALLVHEGTPLALRVARVLASAGCAPVSVVGRQGGLVELGLPVVVEPEHPGHHPLFGVAAALAHARPAEFALVCPCDLVDLRPSTVAQLLRERPCVAVGARRQPLLAVWPTAAYEDVLRGAHQGLSAHALARGLPTVEVAEADLRNANSPQDLGLTSQ